MTHPSTLVPIPQPPSSWWLGHLNQIDKSQPIQGFMRLAKELGPIYQLNILGRRLVMVSSQALVQELSDDSRFSKRLSMALKHIRALGGDGLFTAYNEEPNWGKAHRLLMPAFGPLGVRQMFDGMTDIADQMFTKWRRFGEQAEIDVADNMTRLTLDTIALCGFNYRFNSFYQPELHPFVGAMVGALRQSGDMSRRPAWLNRLLFSQQKQFAKDVAFLKKISEHLVSERRQQTTATPKDLLDIMLQGVDSVTGERLSDENVGYQMVTFLIAGHETTSGLLSFATHLLLKHPQVMAQLSAEIDAVVGDQPLQVDHLAQLRYTEQVLFETLRLWPTAPAYTLKTDAPTTLGGRYALDPDDVIFVLLPSLHRDPQAWGPDVLEFKPERFAPEAQKKIPPHAWKPFGNGARACIGRPFALQEATLVLAKMVQQFDIEAVNPDYVLQVAETLTLKPSGLLIRAKPRMPEPSRGTTPDDPTAAAPRPTSTAAVAGAPPPLALRVLYGSNAGSCQAFAEKIVAQATQKGFAAQLQTLDEASIEWAFDGPPSDPSTPVLIVTASYEGQPTDNAREFMDWLSLQGPDSLKGLHFCVLGCGNRQWASTYQAVPKRIDQALAEAGGTRLRPRGQADANADFLADFETWLQELWPVLTATRTEGTA